MMKPLASADCALPLSILVSVHDALSNAGQNDQLDEFFERAERCSSPQQLVQIASEYVEIASR
jgi:hypothetical protein